LEISKPLHPNDTEIGINPNGTKEQNYIEGNGPSVLPLLKNPPNQKNMMSEKKGGFCGCFGKKASGVKTGSDQNSNGDSLGIPPPGPAPIQGRQDVDRQKNGGSGPEHQKLVVPTQSNMDSNLNNSIEGTFTKERAVFEERRKQIESELNHARAAGDKSLTHVTHQSKPDI
jgi:hypothetical protein